MPAATSRAERAQSDGNVFEAVKAHVMALQAKGGKRVDLSRCGARARASA